MKNVTAITLVSALAFVGTPAIAADGSSLFTTTPSGTSGSNPSAQSFEQTQTQFNQATVNGMSGLAKGMDNHEQRINELEVTTVRQPALENESKARVKESEERIANDASTNIRVDGAYALLKQQSERSDYQQARIEDNARQNEDQQVWITDVQTKADTAVSKIPVFEKGIDDNSKRLDGLDRKTDQTAADASYGRGKADFADQSATRAHNRLDGLDTKTDATNTKVASQGDQINSIAKQQTQTTYRLNQTNQTVSKLGDRTTTLEAGQREQTETLNGHQSQINTLNENVVDLSKSQHAQDATLSDHESRIKANTQGLAKTNERVADQQQQINTKAGKADVERVENHVGQVESRTTVVEGRTTKVEAVASSALATGNAAYQNSQINAQNIETLNQDVRTVDRASIERSKAAVFESKAYTDSELKKVYSQMDDIRREERNGIAAVAALSGIPAVAGKTFDIGVGAANFKNSNAIAVGMHYRPSENNTFKLGVSTSNSNDAVIAGGFSHGF